MSERPARLAGLGEKGAIAEGKDADIVVFDLDAEFPVSPEMIHHRHKLTPYRGERLHGVVRATFVRGEMVYEEGRHIGAPSGKWLRAGT